MSEERKFDEAAFDAAVAKPNGWSGVADPVAEIRRMRGDGDDENLGKLVLRKALSLVRAHFDGADDVFLATSRELAAILDESGRGGLASFVRAQTGDEPSWVPMERKPRSAAPGNAAALREAAERICSIDQSDTQDLRQLAQFCHDQSIYGGGLIERVLADIEIVRQALSAPPEPPSNVAVMREALESCLNFIMRIDRAFSPFMQNLLVRAMAKAKAGLAAPARNCDRPFRSANEAIGAYVGERGDGPHLGYCDAIKWALAPAEGGAK